MPSGKLNQGQYLDYFFSKNFLLKEKIYER